MSQKNSQAYYTRAKIWDESVLLLELLYGRLGNLTVLRYGLLLDFLVWHNLTLHGAHETIADIRIPRDMSQDVVDMAADLDYWLTVKYFFRIAKYAYPAGGSFIHFILPQKSLAEQKERTRRNMSSFPDKHGRWHSSNHPNTSAESDGQSG